MRRRKTYGKSAESSSSVNTDKGKTKDERESDFIENGCKASPDDEEDDEEDDETGESPAQSIKPSVTRPTVLIITKRCMQMSV